MEKLVNGDVVVLPFPFSVLTASKKRPALVAATLDGDDVVLCQITSEARFDKYAIELLQTDFNDGGLNTASTIRPNRFFTADKSIIAYKVGSLNERKIKQVEEKIISIFTAPS